MDLINDDKMIANLEKALKQKGELTPPAYLLENIMASIILSQRKTARRWLVINSVLTALVSGLIVYVAPQIFVQFYQSSLGATLSLIWSDFGYVMANWTDFSWLLLESLPVNAILLGSAGLLSLLFLIKSIVRNLDRTHFHYHFKSQKI